MGIAKMEKPVQKARESKAAGIAVASGGLGFSLAAYGTFLWGAGFVMPSSLLPGQLMLYTVVGLMGALTGFLVRPFALLTDLNVDRIPPLTLPVVFAAGLVTLIAAVSLSSSIALLLSGAAIGFSVSGFFLFWLRNVSLPNARTKQVSFAFSLLVAAVVNVVVLVVPRSAALVTACVAIGVPLVSLFAWALKGQKPADSALAGGSAQERCEGSARRPSAKSDKLGYQRAFRGLTIPLVCACVLFVVVPALNYVALQDRLPWEQRILSIIVAQCISAMLLLVVFKVLRRPPYMEALYKVVSPLLVLAMFVVPFAGSSFSRVFLMLGSCMFFMVTVLLMLDCVSIADKTKTDCSVLYGVCGAVTFLVRFCAEQIMRAVNSSGISWEIQMVATALFVVYLLGFALMMAQNYRRAQERLELAESVQSKAMLEKLPWSWAPNSCELECCVEIGDSAGLSEREFEVFQMLLRGKNVPMIAEELVVSQNTVRSHVKRIYRLLGVHSRAELIASFESAVQERQR